MKLFGGKGQHAAPRTAQAVMPRRKEEKETAPLPSEKTSGAGRSRLRKILIVLGCMVLAFLLMIVIYKIWEKPPEVQQGGLTVQTTPQPVHDPVPETSAAPVISEETPTPSETPEETVAPVTVARKEGCYTFLLLAYDQLQANTDTILVGRMDTEEGTLNVVNVPRDTLVNVSWGVKKLNTVLASERNDPEKFKMHLGNLIGFTVDCYAIVDIDAVEKLVDCIGGVYYNVPRDMDYDDPSQDLSIHIPQGYQLLNGENAVKVLRFRVGNNGSGYANGDLGRIATQQDFLMSMVSQFLKIGNIPNLNEALEIFQTHVRTDLTANNMAFFVREFLNLDRENISFRTVPGDGTSVRGGSYYEIAIDEWVSIVNEALNPYNQVITADNLNILQSAGAEGAVSTTGEILPLTSFYDFSQYKG